MNLKQLTRTLVVAGLVGLAGCSVAADGGAKQIAAVKEKLAKKLPGRSVTAVNVSPMGGLYEVVMDGKMIVYTDAKVEYLVFGDMVDIEKRKSVTEERVAELRKVDFAKLPFELAIKDVRGDGSRKLAVFSEDRKSVV